MKKKVESQVNRRSFVKQSASVVVGAAALPSWTPFSETGSPGYVYQSMGTRVGEVTSTSAIVWTRLTALKERNQNGLNVGGAAKDYKKSEIPKVTVPVEELEGACGGAVGFVRLRYGTDKKLLAHQTTDWVGVAATTDFIHQFRLEDLKPGTIYYYVSESAAGAGKGPLHTFGGKFMTAPKENVAADLRFCLMTCQGYPDRGHADGHEIYPSMLALNPHFTCLTGDLVYYDNDLPMAVNERLARYHWERMFSLPRLIEFNRNVGTYWLKDDHDTLNNDSGPGDNMGELTFGAGQEIFHQQAPLSAEGPSYRTFRWGKDLQIWFTDGRDFRSPNDMPDGPEKTILGKEQKAWLKNTIKKSSATWKVLVSPTPLVGPDRTNKNDNHANPGFSFEGDELRNWFRENVPDNFFVICGDRHWQYHSVHPKFGLHEFSIGAASDEHAAGSPGENPDYHRFHLVKGGFMSVDLKRAGNKSIISFQHHSIHGQVVYKFEKERFV